jgi:hypothetical protein
MTRSGPRRALPKRKMYPCDGYDSKTGRRRKYARHNYTLQIDSDGNYRVCARAGCGMVSLRLAAGERGRVR